MKAKSRPPQYFAAYWSHDRLAGFAKTVSPGYRFDRLFGGVHKSMPSFKRLRPGDWIYLIGMRARVLQVYGRMQVRCFHDIDDYTQTNPEEFASPDPGQSLRPRDAWRAAHPEIATLWWSCAEEIAFGTSGSAFARRAALDPQATAALRFVIGKLEKALPMDTAGIVKSNFIEGIRRITEDSAALLARCLLDAEAIDAG